MISKLSAGLAKAIALPRLDLESLEVREIPSVGGGFTNSGLDGVYYSDPNFTNSAFTRRDLRIDFDWGTTVKPGGSNSPGFRDVGTDNYSARWTGQLIPRFSETYTFSGVADDTFKLELKPAGSANWTTVVNQTADAASFSGSMALQAGQAYDVRISYQEFTGAAEAKLLWSSPSTPQEVIDPLNQAGFNNPDGTEAFTDLVKGARNTWDTSSPLDANGWPMGDALYYFQESLNQGLSVDPLMEGTIQFSFTGQAIVAVMGNVDNSSLIYNYDSSTNVTSGSFNTRDNAANASAIQFTNSSRTGQPGGPGGITDLKLLRPTAPNATTNYSADTIFTTDIKDYARNYTLIRYQYVANQQMNWSDRTLPSYFNQAEGSQTAPTYPLPWDTTSDNGWSWEYKVMFANETGTDLMISIPPLATGQTIADTNSYLVKLAELLKYGSDGVNPYTAPTANPVYPPLNSNLRVYLEIGNELWNWAGTFYTDYNNINQLVKQELLANSPTFQAINYDGLSITPDGNGSYTNMDTWRYRYIVYRMTQISDIFRGVFGDAAMPGSQDVRIRPLYEWQYDNLNNTAELGLTWADHYFNKTDPASTFTGPARPVNYYLWGGGGATYYGANNPAGLTSLLPNSGFETTAVPVGYTQTPAGENWTFTGTAGIARDGGSGDDIPPPYDGNQMGYIAGNGQITGTFTVPTDQTSNVYAVAFKAVNRMKVGATAADTQNLRVYLDYGTPNQIDLTAPTYSQSNGYTPPDYGSISPWEARNVFWTTSDYYYTKSINLTAGSTHTITIVGTAAPDQVAFLEDVHVTSVDAIFAGGIPGGGEATGQPAGQNIRNTMNTAVSWAAAFGLNYLAYESGWSLGGDDGGSFIQLDAKYGDSRTVTAQTTFMDYFDQAGGMINVFGTYTQIPSWSDNFAQQGLLDSTSYPIIQGIDQRANQLAADPTNGTLAPAILSRTNVTLSDQAVVNNGQISAVDGWLSWNVIIPRSGTYALQVTSQSGGSLVLLADDVAVTQGNSGDVLTATTFLTQGLHSIKVRSAAGSFVVTSINLTSPGAPASPAIAGLTARNDSVSLNWATVPNAAGYIVQYGTVAGQYTNRLDVGANTSQTVSGLANNTTYYFAVSSYSADGTESLPSASQGVTVLIEGQVGGLAQWQFTGLVSGAATAPAIVAPSSTAAGVTVSPLSRGAGLYPATDWMTYWFPDRFGSGAVGDVWATTLANAIASNQYYQFTVTAAPGVMLELSQLQLQVWFSDSGNANNQVAIQYSTDGQTFSNLGFTGTPNNDAGLTVPLTDVTAVQNPSGTLTFRVYTYGTGSYNATGIGMGTSADALLISGSVRSTPTIQSVVVNDGSAQRSMVNTLTVAFNTLVNLGTNAFIVQPQKGGAAVPIIWTTAEVDGRTVATISFVSGSVSDGQWQLSTNAAAIVHQAGGAVMAANQTDNFYRLFGDVNGDGAVNGSDLFSLRPALSTALGQLSYVAAFDYNGDGVVNGLDFFQFRAHYATHI